MMIILLTSFSSFRIPMLRNLVAAKLQAFLITTNRPQVFLTFKPRWNLPFKLTQVKTLILRLIPIILERLVLLRTSQLLLK
jgi:hypothetical protein